MATYPFPMELASLVFNKLDGPSSVAASQASRIWYYLYFQQLRLHPTSSHFLSDEQWLAYKKVTKADELPNRKVVLLASESMTGKKTVLLKHLMHVPGKTIIACSADTSYQWQEVGRRLYNGLHNFGVIISSDDDQTVKQKLETFDILFVSCSRAEPFQGRLTLFASDPQVKRIIFTEMGDMGGDKGGWLGSRLKGCPWTVWITGAMDIHTEPSVKRLIAAMHLDVSSIPIITLDSQSKPQHIIHRADLVPTTQYDAETVCSSVVPSPRRYRVMPWDREKINCLHDVRRLLKQNWKVSPTVKNFKVERIFELLVEKAINRKEKCIVVSFSSIPLDHCEMLLNSDPRTHKKFDTYSLHRRSDQRLAAIQKFNRGETNILLCYHSDLLKVGFVGTKHIIVIEPPTDRNMFNNFLMRTTEIGHSREPIQCWHLLYKDCLEPRIFEWTTMHQNYQKDVVGFLKEFSH